MKYCCHNLCLTYILTFFPRRIWCISKSYSATPRPTWHIKVRIFPLGFMHCIGCNDWLILLILFLFSRQLEALDKELQQLSKIKENVDAKVLKTFLVTSYNQLQLTNTFDVNFLFIYKKGLFCFVLNFLFIRVQLELRKKQFHVLLSTIQELQQTLESK